MKNKKAQSQIVSTVLLILLVIVAVMIVIEFVIPFIRDKLSGTECIDVAGKITIQNNPSYTCYEDAPSNQMRIQIHNGDTENLTKGFQINIQDSGAGKSFEIISGNPDSVSMYLVGGFELPGKNEERTYVLEGINDLPDSASIYPILKDSKICEVSDTLNYIGYCE